MGVTHMTPIMWGATNWGRLRNLTIDIDGNCQLLADGILGGGEQCHRHHSVFDQGWTLITKCNIATDIRRRGRGEEGAYPWSRRASSSIMIIGKSWIMGSGGGEDPLPRGTVTCNKCILIMITFIDKILLKERYSLTKCFWNLTPRDIKRCGRVKKIIVRTNKLCTIEHFKSRYTCENGLPITDLS